MDCPICGHDDNGVRKTTHQEGAVRRIRQCWTCGYRWATVEIPADEWKHGKTIRALAGALAQAIADPRQIHQGEGGARMTIVVDADSPAGPGPGVR